MLLFIKNSLIFKSLVLFYNIFKFMNRFMNRVEFIYSVSNATLFYRINITPNTYLYKFLMILDYILAFRFVLFAHIVLDYYVDLSRSLKIR